MSVTTAQRFKNESEVVSRETKVSSYIGRDTPPWTRYWIVMLIVTALELTVPSFTLNRKLSDPVAPVFGV